MTISRICSAALLVAAAGFGVSACDESLADLAGPTPTLQPTFSSIQTNIFDNGDSSGRLACTSCHNAVGSRFSGGLNLTEAVSYASLVNAASSGKPGAVRVIPGDGTNSYLIHKLEGRSGIVGLRMPTSGPYLSAGQIAIIQTWIANGARND